VPYRSLLQQLVASVRGAEGALLLDETGELVVEIGEPQEERRLIGAYQGIALSTAKRIVARYPVGGVGYITGRYRWGTLVLRPLKDGYYLVLALTPDAAVAVAVHQSGMTQDRLNQAL
jgi:predicted regulator of Ras-like GTPase activity (Roadblock/LC7/MglB family)